MTARLTALAKDLLQDKSDRDYFLQGARLKPGQFHLSPLDLNVEQGSIQIPLKPVYRLSAPVAGTGGEASGLVVLNVLAAPILKGLDGSQTAPWQLYLVDRQGNWLKGPRPPAGRMGGT